MHRHFRFTPLILIVLLLATTLLSGCQAPGADQAQTAPKLRLADPASLPRHIHDAPARVRETYQFAVSYPDALANVPCYCGCGSMGHTSNLACYLKPESVGKELVFDDHALGCSLCVDIAQDVMRLTGDGVAAPEVRAQILATYSKFGPPNQ